MNISTDVQPGQVICMDNFFTSVKLFSDLQARNIGASGTVRSNRVGNPPQSENLKKGTTKRVLQGLSTDCWVV